MTTSSLPLKSFSQIVQDVKAFYHGYKPNDMNDWSGIVRFEDAYVALDEELSIENVKNVLKIVSQFPVLELENDNRNLSFWERHEDVAQFHARRNAFNAEYEAQAYSYLCKLDDYDYDQFQIIEVRMDSCDSRDVILYKHELYIVDYIENEKCHTVSFNIEEEKYESFEMGKNGIPHYILGKVRF